MKYNILITGGAGSLGSALAERILNYQIKSISIFDNNEHSLFQLKRSLKDKRIKFLLGDINNKEIMIPYTKEIIHRVDNFKKEIHVIIPKGLLDLN